MYYAFGVCQECGGERPCWCEQAWARENLWPDDEPEPKTKPGGYVLTLEPPSREVSLRLFGDAGPSDSVCIGLRHPLPELFSDLDAVITHVSRAGIVVSVDESAADDGCGAVSRQHQVLLPWGEVAEVHRHYSR